MIPELLRDYEELPQSPTWTTNSSPMRFSQPWKPPLNAFRCDDGFSICMEIAGTDPASIQVEFQKDTLVVRGQRSQFHPDGRPLGHVLTMEIDQGPFERSLKLPAAVNSSAFTQEHRAGLLWIHLPLADASSPTRGHR